MLAGIACLALIAPDGTASAAETGSISGTVVDSSGKGLHGAIVSAINEDRAKEHLGAHRLAGPIHPRSAPAGPVRAAARLVGFDDSYLDEIDVREPATATKPAKFVMQPAKDLLRQRNGASLFGELKIDDEEQRMSFKMSCTYCHQVGTSGFRTPEEPVDWEVMITRMDGFGALHPDLKKTIVKKLVDTYAEDAPKKWPKWTPPEAPKGKALALRVVEWDMGNKRQTMIHDLELGHNGLVYAVDMANDTLVSLDPKTGERKDVSRARRQGALFGRTDAHGPALAGVRRGRQYLDHLCHRRQDGQVRRQDRRVAMVSSAPDPAQRGIYPHTLARRSEGRRLVHRRRPRRVQPGSQQRQRAQVLQAASDEDQAVGQGVGESRGRTPYGIDVAPNGHIWYTKLNGNRVGRIKPEVPDGDIKEWNPPFHGPRRLQVAADGMVWVPGCGSGVFAKFDPETEKWTVYDLPDKENQFPYALNVHPQTGDIWICGTTNDSMFRFIPKTEELIEYPMPSRVTYTREIEFGDDGSVWVCNSNWPNRHTERRLGSIIRITLDGTVDEATDESRAVAVSKAAN